jgi:hypothetical protein
MSTRPIKADALATGFVPPVALAISAAAVRGDPLLPRAGAARRR